MSNLLRLPTLLPLMRSIDDSGEAVVAQDGWGLFLLVGIAAVLVVGAVRLWMKVK